MKSGLGRDPRKGGLGPGCSQSGRRNLKQVPGSSPTCVSSESLSRGGFGIEGPVLTFPSLKACVPFNFEVFRMVEFAALIFMGLG